MRKVVLSPYPMGASVEVKLDWMARSIQAIANASGDADPNVYADEYTLTNVTATRTLDCDTTTTAQLADVVATFIQDHQTRGSRRT